MNGEPQAIVWNVWDAGSSYYFMGAKNPKVDNYRAMSALLWHSMRMAKARGNHTFDMEGSMDPGVERFFRNFGGRRELYLVLRKDGHWLWRLLRMMGK
jgi:lipid II:glycine glycyltransferase (peptidoglycan interpeptide bridge formation enzyme)